ncbi:uncharacterized protein LOC108844879 [Raphanus sativus]|uniref:Uncharacterized protein LOC108844879 n=1 Tax=Raphanus sativus TaxID=3726 RepID=A0A6J0MQ64_RAPSA|nr:uncharacterized protein LOC108844879 [Raphanus sativus]
MLVLKLRKKGILLTLQMERLPKIIIQMGPTASQLTMTGTRTVVGWSTGGRIVVVWDPSVSVFVYSSSAQAVTCGIFIMAENVHFTVTFVYGFNEVEARKSLWNELSLMNRTTPVSYSPWSVVGDFNQIIRVSNHSDYPNSVIDISGMEDMNMALQDAELLEAQAKGSPFTWWNNQIDNPISKKIDHAFINQDWVSKFHDSYAEFLEPDQSDHAPSEFRVSTDNLTSRSRSNQYKLVRSLKCLKGDLRRLNKTHYSGISQRVKEQSRVVEGLQRTLLTTPDSNTAEEEHRERAKLNLLLTAEQKFYRQRSRVRWADVGDRNTPFFHKMVAQRVTRNHIHFLKDDNDQFIGTAEGIKAHSAAYFQRILGSTDMPTSPVTVDELQGLLDFRCSDLQQRYLSREVTAAEIRATVFSMPLNKSSGPDGYCVEFLRASWDTVGQDVVNAVTEFFRNGRLLKDLNTTAITLIPKTPEACMLGEYRPISCCNIVYKTSFLKGRSLGDNVLLATELIQSYNSANYQHSCTVKVDIRKAFDTVCWNFVIKLLQAQSFPPIFITWIRECMTSPRFSVSINGELAGFFAGKKGLRQGDSISPYLFIMIMEVLSKLFEKLVDDEGMRLHPLCANPRVTHLLFADDLLVFSDGSCHSIFGIKGVMRMFKCWTGLDINPAKSEIFLGGYADIEAAVLSDLSGFKRGSFPTRYLGLPLNPSRLNSESLQPFLERITNKLHSWTVKCLSFAGKIRMVTSVIYGMVNFWSSVFTLPKRFYAKVDSLCSAFLWNNKTTSATGARVSWESICQPKQEGGLGIRKLEDYQSVFQLKRVWNYFSSPESPWSRYLSNNVFNRNSYWTMETTARVSATVRNMISIKPTVEYFLRCAIGDGRSASFWFDWWTDMGPLISAIGPTGPRDLRLPLSSTVSEATNAGNWLLPAARSDEVETLQIVLSTMPAPSPSRGKDCYLWRSGNSSYDKKFSTKRTWEQIRVPVEPVSWVNLVWFKEEIPRCSFFTWLSVLQRLPTRDRLASWGMNVPTHCMLCSSAEEIHAHLFFRCSYASSVWSHFCVGRFLSAPPDSIIECSTVLRDHLFSSVPRAGPVLKLILQVVIYCLWRERNAHIFTATFSPASVLASKIDRMVRDRLLSIPSPSSSQPSLLLLYLSFLYDVS